MDSSVQSGKKRKRPEGKAVEAAPLALSHRLAGCTYTSLHLPKDSSYIDVFMAPLANVIAPESVDGRPIDQEIIVYTQGRELKASEWKTAFFKGEIPIEVLSSGIADARDHSNLYFAVLRFSDPATAHKALQTPASFPTTDADGSVLGLRGWLEAHKSYIFDARVLQSAVDKYVTEFDAAEAAEDKARSELERRMDADGFTLVKRAAKKLDEEEDKFESENARRKKKRGSIVKTDFYAFQRQENKFDKLTQLKARFEEDKEKIRRIKENRKFRPY